MVKSALALLPFVIQTVGEPVTLNTDPKFTVMSMITEDSVTFVATLEAAKWFAFGFNGEAEKMVGAQVVVANPGSNSVEQHQLDGKRENAGEQPSMSSSILDASFVYADGVGTMTWTRLLDNGNRVTLKDDEKTLANAIWAIGDDNTLPLAYHDNRGFLKLNVATGDAIIGEDDNTSRIAHGTLMFLAWGIFAPFGMMIARFAKEREFGNAGKWFTRYHRPMMIGAVLLTTIGFVIALIMVDGNHFAVTHTYMGLVVVLLALYQPINAALRGTPQDHHDMTFKRRFFEIVHKWVGRFTIFFAILTIFSGLQFFDANDGVKYGYVAWIVAAIAIPFIVLTYQHLTKGKEPAASC